MIVLRQFRLTRTSTGKLRLMDQSVLKKWGNRHDFGFNIFDANNWRLYLRSLRNSEGPLKQHLYAGEEVRYEVYMWGVPKKILSFHQCVKSGGYLNLFPGYYANCTKKDIRQEGWLYPPKLQMK